MLPGDLRRAPPAGLQGHHSLPSDHRAWSGSLRRVSQAPAPRQSHGHACSACPSPWQQRPHSTPIFSVTLSNVHQTNRVMKKVEAVPCAGVWMHAEVIGTCRSLAAVGRTRVAHPGRRRWQHLQGPAGPTQACPGLSPTADQGFSPSTGASPATMSTESVFFYPGKTERSAVKHVGASWRLGARVGRPC